MRRHEVLPDHRGQHDGDNALLPADHLEIASAHPTRYQVPEPARQRAYGPSRPPFIEGLGGRVLPARSPPASRGQTPFRIRTASRPGRLGRRGLNIVFLAGSGWPGEHSAVSGPIPGCFGCLEFRIWSVRWKPRAGVSSPRPVPCPRSPEGDSLDPERPYLRRDRSRCCFLFRLAGRR